jgi:hypothetical protein
MPVTREQLTTNLFLLEDLENPTGKRDIAESDRDALRTVADWIRAFIVKPNNDLGRSGPVCPFVPGALERKTMWLAPEHRAGRSTSEVADLILAYQKVFIETPPAEDDVNHKAIVVVFTDLAFDRAEEFFDAVLEQIAIPSFVNSGFAMGGSFKGYEATGIHNLAFRPFVSPVPFLLVRHSLVEDWKFFLDNDEWIRLWARRYGDSGALALADELRTLQWRSPRTTADSADFPSSTDRR